MKIQLFNEESAELLQNDFMLLSKWKSLIMGFSALWIFLFHEWVLMFQNHPKIGVIEEFVKHIGFCGVDIFFILSGLGMTYAIKKSSTISFYWKRIKKVMIPFAIIGFIIAVMDNWGAELYFKNILGINFFTTSMYSFLWFVTAIMTFYLAFPIYYKFFEKSKNKILFTIGALEIWLILSIMFSNILRNDLYGFTNRIPVFLIGVLLGWLCQNKTIRFTNGTWLFLIINLFLGGYLSYLCNYKGFYILVPVSNCCFPNMLMSFSLVFLLAKLFDIISKKARLTLLSKGLTKFFGFFGMISLEFYCVQEWICNKLTELKLPFYGNGILNLQRFVVTIIYALCLMILSNFVISIINWIEKKVKAMNFSLHKKI